MFTTLMPGPGDLLVYRPSPVMKSSHPRPEIRRILQNHVRVQIVRIESNLRGRESTQYYLAYVGNKAIQLLGIIDVD